MHVYYFEVLALQKHELGTGTDRRSLWLIMSQRDLTLTQSGGEYAERPSLIAESRSGTCGHLIDYPFAHQDDSSNASWWLNLCFSPLEETRAEATVVLVIIVWEGANCFNLLRS